MGLTTESGGAARRRSPVKIILTVLVCGVMLAGAATLLTDKLRAEKQAKDMYPDAQILAAEPQNSLLTGTVTCALYDPAEQLVFQQNFERSFCFMHPVTPSGNGYDAQKAKREALSAALERFSAQTDAEYFVRYRSDGEGVHLFTQASDPDTLAAMCEAMLAAMPADGKQSFSVVSCSAADYAQIQSGDPAEQTALCTQIGFFDGVQTIMPASDDAPMMLGMPPAYSRFDWQSSSWAEAYADRLRMIENGEMAAYPEFNADAMTEWYCDVYAGFDSMQYGVRQWAHTSGDAHYNKRTKRWDSPVGQVYVFSS